VKEKPSLYRSSRQKYITQDAEFFPDMYTIRHIARHRKKNQGSGIYREAAIMSSF
jgi:hypothetical protein